MQTVFSDENENEYKVVELGNEDGCILTTTDNGSEINGCFGVDAAYLYEANGQVYFMQSGTINHISKDNVKIVEAKDYYNKLTSYKNINGVLYHNIKTDLESDYYSYSLAIDDAPSYLKENTIYYSYDGHYFYDNYNNMIDDYVNNKNDNAINKTAYYNYYQYLPFRTISNYTYKEIDEYIKNKMHIDGPLGNFFDYNNDGANDYINKSQYYNKLESFFVSEEIYGINSMILLSTSMYESSYGKSLDSYMRNNLFDSAAFSTTQETQNQRYDSLENSVYAFAKYYMADKNSNPIRRSYNGSFLGNKESGMNKSYSGDPYWSEKVVSVYYAMDKALGYKDKNAIQIAIINNPSVYKDIALSNRLYKVEGNDYAYPIVEEETSVYKIQVDKNSSYSNLYDYENEVGYISKDKVVLIGSNTINKKEYETYTFDFNEGYVDGNEKVTIKTSKEVVKPTPTKNGYDFMNYDDNNVAQYKKISTVSYIYNFNDRVEVDSYPNIEGTSIIVHYSDGTLKNIHVTSEMIKDFDSSEDGETTFNLYYSGFTVPIKMKVNQWPKLIRADVESLITNIINNKQGINEENIKYIKNNNNGVNLSFDDIRHIDYYCLKETNSYPVYYIEQNDLDLSLSGLGFSLSNNKKKGKYQFYDDTFYIKTSDIPSSSYSKLSEIANDYGFEVEGSTKLSFRYNLLSVEPSSTIIAQVKINNKRNDRYYSVYHLDKSGNVIKCKTTQSNSYIQFAFDESGDYIFLSRPSGNIYNIKDINENISYLNNGIDTFSIMTQIMLFIVLMLYNFVCIIMYYLFNNNREKRWNDYRKSLRLAVSVHEEKLKN